MQRRTAVYIRSLLGNLTYLVADAAQKNTSQKNTSQFDESALVVRSLCSAGSTFSFLDTMNSAIALTLLAGEAFVFIGLAISVVWFVGNAALVPTGIVALLGWVAALPVTWATLRVVTQREAKKIEEKYRTLTSEVPSEGWKKSVVTKDLGAGAPAGGEQTSTGLRRYALLSGVVFSIIAIGHLVRLIYGWPVAIAGRSVPSWITAFGLAITGGLAVWAFLARATDKPK
jgi:hypothetical protein